MRLHELKDLKGFHIAATDGKIGSVSDFLFDDVHWAVRYMVVDTGNWLPGRQVLVSPQAITGDVDEDKEIVHVKLTREQIENSPGIQQDMPVSRQNEVELAQYYGWATYWDRLPSSAPASMGQTPPANPPAETGRGDPKLRSVRELSGYSVQARGHKAGHVDDAIAETVGWMIRYLVVDTGDWLEERLVLISPAVAM